MARVELRHVRKRFGDIVAVEDFSLDAAEGEFIVFVGPSGCGKTTTMRIIAGLEVASEGEVLFDGKNVSDECRTTATLRWCSRTTRFFRISTSIRTSLSECGCERSRSRKSRIASARRPVCSASRACSSDGRRSCRAVSASESRWAAPSCAKPRVFLMDEPLSNLDAALRMEMRAEIIKLQERLGVTTFYVTHDQVEALSMGDRIVVMRDGRIQQVGSPTELYKQPKNTYVASFIGSPPMNFLEGRIDGDRILLPAEKAVLGENGAIRRALVGAAAPEIMLGIRPEHIVLSDEPARADAFSIAGAVDTVEPLGHTTLVRAKTASERVLNVLLEGKVRLQEGQAVHATFPADRVYLFDRKSEQSLLGISQ